MQFTINKKLYVVNELVGRGGYSKVYSVVPSGVGVSKERLAVKHIELYGVDHEVRQGFTTEIALLAKLRGEESVVQLLDYEQTPTALNLLTELGDGDLSMIISSQKLEVQDVRRFARQIFAGVEAIHRHGIVHSDLKPQNFICVGHMLKLIDFGISNIPLENTCNVYRSKAIGTLLYMAPETLRIHSLTQKPNKHSVCAASDVWACGCIVYEMIYGETPFEGFDDIITAIIDASVEIKLRPRGKEFDVPWDLQELMERCMTRSVCNRWTAEEALSSLALSTRVVGRSDLERILRECVAMGEKRKLGPDEIKKLARQYLLALESC